MLLLLLLLCWLIALLLVLLCVVLYLLNLFILLGTVAAAVVFLALLLLAGLWPSLDIPGEVPLLQDTKHFTADVARPGPGRKGRSGRKETPDREEEQRGRQRRSQGDTDCDFLLEPFRCRR